MSLFGALYDDADPADPARPGRPSRIEANVDAEDSAPSPSVGDVQTTPIEAAWETFSAETFAAPDVAGARAELSSLAVTIASSPPTPPAHAAPAPLAPLPTSPADALGPVAFDDPEASSDPYGVEAPAPADESRSDALVEGPVGRDDLAHHAALLCDDILPSQPRSRSPRVGAVPKVAKDVAMVVVAALVGFIAYKIVFPG